jgi:hypothetical protein
VARPVAPPPVAKPAAEKELIEHLPVDPAEEEWRSLPLELRKDQSDKPDVDLDRDEK